MKRCFRMIGMCVCFILCVTAIAGIMYLKYEKYKEQKMFDSLMQYTEEQQAETEEIRGEQSISEQIEENQEEESSTEVEIEKEILPEYRKLYSENSDLYGWIKIDDTEVDYPVMYTPLNQNFYLHRNFDKEDSFSGVPFLEVPNAPNNVVTEDTENIIIYAHNMKNGTMFGSLKKYYKDKSYFEKHRYIEFDTLYEKAKYEIISVSSAVVYYNDDAPENEYLFYDHTELDTEEEFNEYIENMKKNALFDIETTAQAGDKLITLCTCDHTFNENGRLLIVAKKV